MQSLETIQTRHHDIQYGDVMLFRQRRLRPAEAIVATGDAEPVAFEVVAQHADQFEIVIDQEDIRPCGEKGGVMHGAILWQAKRCGSNFYSN